MSARRLFQQVAISWSSLIFKPGLVKRLIHTKPLLYSNTSYSSSRKLPFHHLPKCHFFTSEEEASFNSDEEAATDFEEYFEEVEEEMDEERQREREDAMWAGLTKDILIQKLEEEKLKGDASADLDLVEEPTDSESNVDHMHFTKHPFFIECVRINRIGAAQAAKMNRFLEQFEFKRHKELLENFVGSGHGHQGSDQDSIRTQLSRDPACLLQNGKDEDEEEEEGDDE